jgi:hypothetical protein
MHGLPPPSRQVFFFGYLFLTHCIRDARHVGITQVDGCSLGAYYLRIACHLCSNQVKQHQNGGPYGGSEDPIILLYVARRLTNVGGNFKTYILYLPLRPQVAGISMPTHLAFVNLNKLRRFIPLFSVLLSSPVRLQAFRRASGLMFVFTFYVTSIASSSAYFFTLFFLSSVSKSLQARWSSEDRIAIPSSYTASWLSRAALGFDLRRGTRLARDLFWRPPLEAHFGWLVTSEE